MLICLETGNRILNVPITLPFSSGGSAAVLLVYPPSACLMNSRPMLSQVRRARAPKYSQVLCATTTQGAAAAATTCAHPKATPSTAHAEATTASAKAPATAARPQPEAAAISTQPDHPTTCSVRCRGLQF